MRIGSCECGEPNQEKDWRGVYNTVIGSEYRFVGERIEAETA